MTTKRESVLDYLPSFLNEDGTLLALEAWVERERRSPVQKSARYRVNVVPESDARMETGGKDYVDRRLSLDFQIHVRGADTSGADAIADALHNKLMSNRTLGGRCRDIVAGDNDFEWKWSEEDTDMCMVHQRYDVIYRSLETDLSA